MLISTTFDFSGFDVTANLGEVFGLTVRSRNIGSGIIAVFRSIGGGEIPEFTNLLIQSRNEAMARMVEQAASRGANAVIGMRFDGGAFGQWSEICAYGTAVFLTPQTEYASTQLAASHEVGLPHQVGYNTRVSEWQPPPS